MFDPGVLHSTPDGVRPDVFNGGDGLSRDCGDRGDAASDGRTVEMHGARAAQRHAATELGAGHVERVAQGPEQGSGRVDIDLHDTAVQLKRDHRDTS